MTRSGAPAQAAQQPFPRMDAGRGAPVPGRPPAAATPGIISPDSAPTQSVPVPQVSAPSAGSADDAVILTRDLTKTFGERTVVEGMNLVVWGGMVCGFLLPHSA